MKKMKLQMLGLSVNDLLSREQMKKVMGGSGDGSGDTGCKTNPCSVYVAGPNGTKGTTYYGHCGYGGIDGCECQTSYGDYRPSGTSHCAA